MRLHVEFSEQRSCEVDIDLDDDQAHAFLTARTYEARRAVIAPLAIEAAEDAGLFLHEGSCVFAEHADPPDPEDPLDEPPIDGRRRRRAFGT
jgi:hypothetical protein